MADETPLKEEHDVVVTLREIASLKSGPDGRSPARVNALAVAPGDDTRLYVVDMDGLIHVLKNGALENHVLLDMRQARRDAFVSNDLEKGLAAVAFHPDFSTPGAAGEGRFYTASTESVTSGSPKFSAPESTDTPSHHDVITEWRVTDRQSPRADLSTRREVLRIEHPRRDHTIGNIAFVPNASKDSDSYGLLYIGVGDGGNTFPRYRQTDAFRLAQNTLVPFGKILRIDPLPNGQAPYGVPASNPFFRTPGVLPEIWAYGFRNPQRFCWDPADDNRMVIVDIGQSMIEEINLGKAGGNYGWSEREGMLATDHMNENVLNPLPPDDPRFGYTYPSGHYGRNTGIAISGGFVYRGRLLPALRGKYIFGDIASGEVLFADVRRLEQGDVHQFNRIRFKVLGRERSVLDIVGGSRADLRFGTDADGEIYALTKSDGVIRKFSAVSF